MEMLTWYSVSSGGVKQAPLQLPLLAPQIIFSVLYNVHKKSSLCTFSPFSVWRFINFKLVSEEI